MNRTENISDPGASEEQAEGASVCVQTRAYEAGGGEAPGSEIFSVRPGKGLSWCTLVWGIV